MEEEGSHAPQAHGKAQRENRAITLFGSLYHEQAYQIVANHASQQLFAEDID